MNPRQTSGGPSDLRQVEEEGVAETDEVAGSDGKPTRGPGRKVARFPLSMPRRGPGRLDDLEAMVITRVKEMFDVVHELDQTIEGVHPLLDELMIGQLRRVGVEWRDHKTRPGRHPAVYRTRRGLAYGVALGKGGSGPTAGSRKVVAKRFWVEHVNPPVGLTRFAAHRDEQERAGLMEPQADALQMLQNLIRLRDGALKSVVQLMSSSAAWRRMNLAMVEVREGGRPSVLRMNLQAFELATKDVRLNARVWAAHRMAEAQQSIAENDLDDEERRADRAE